MITIFVIEIINLIINYINRIAIAVIINKYLNY